MMNVTPRPSDGLSGQGASSAGDAFRLQLQCPKCNAEAWVEWRQLPHLLRCRGCDNSFWIGKDGHIQSEHEVGSVRVKCPRCQQLREWPKGLVLKQLSCLSCGFDFSLDRDAPPAAAGERSGADAHTSPASRKTKQSKPLPRAAIAATIAVAIGGALLLVCLPILAIVSAIREDTALIDAVHAFNAAALGGESKKAKDWVSPDQATAFETWMLMNTSNRPLGQLEPVEVKVVQYSSETARVTVSYQRTIQDVARQCQAWRRDPDGHWRFDPTATLQQEE